MLGSEQKKSLILLADAVKRSSAGSCYLLILIHPHRYFTREEGGGAGHNITAGLIYTDNGDSDLRRHISTCTNWDNSREKGKEIGRFLCDELGLSREVVKLREKTS